MDVIDTHTKDDRSMGEILIAEGHAESTRQIESLVNNAPASDDSFRQPEEEELLDDDDCK